MKRQRILKILLALVGVFGVLDLIGAWGFLNTYNSNGIWITLILILSIVLSIDFMKNGDKTGKSQEQSN